MRFVTFLAIAAVGIAVFATIASESDGRTVLEAKLSPESAIAQQLFDELAYQDSVLFDAIFNTCNLEKIGELVTDDFEFYHDKWGLIATTGAQFVESIKNLCERQAKGVDYRARKELVKGSMTVYPLNNYGAIQMGVHRFYAKTEGKEDKLTEVAKFTHVWKKDAGKWKIARVLSYDHKPAE